MSAIAVIGEQEHARTFAFAGVRVIVADDPDAARTAWRSLPADVGLVILTAAAHAALDSELSHRDQRLWVVMPA
jgi:vacuolar-type H+-ATPase subunit F/Vma7